MSLFKTVLTVLSYASAIGGPIVGATGVGMPLAIGLGAVGAGAAVWLHWLDSPRKPEDTAGGRGADREREAAGAVSSVKESRDAPLDPAYAATRKTAASSCSSWRWGRLRSLCSRCSSGAWPSQEFFMAEEFACHDGTPYPRRMG